MKRWKKRCRKDESETPVPTSKYTCSIRGMRRNMYLCTVPALTLCMYREGLHLVPLSNNASWQMYRTRITLLASSSECLRKLWTCVWWSWVEDSGSGQIRPSSPSSSTYSVFNYNTTNHMLSCSRKSAVLFGRASNHTRTCQWLCIDLRIARRQQQQNVPMSVPPPWEHHTQDLHCSAGLREQSHSTTKPGLRQPPG